jgi:large subunit ribosomal protein L6
MSRIGKLPIELANGLKATVSENLLTLDNGKSQASVQLDPQISAKVEDNQIIVERANETKDARAKHGLYRSLINNAVIGLSTGYKKELEIIGVGFRAAVNNGVLELNIGYSHPIFFAAPDEVNIEVDTKRGKNPIVIISGQSKEIVGLVAAKIRSFRKPEPYKGKGIRYVGEQVRRKAGKSAGK